MGSFVGARALTLAVAIVATGCATTGAVVTPSPFPGSPRQSVAGPAIERARPEVELVEGAGRDAIISTALDLRGVRYRLGGASPADGFDCSGFVRFVFAQHQIELPRTVAEQVLVGRTIGVEHAEAGDLVFFTTIAPGASHVGIAIGAGQFIHAPSDGSVVRIDRVDAPYWRARTVEARRVF